MSALEASAPLTRCGVCDQPSARPVCGKCERVLTVERFGTVAQRERERRAGVPERRPS